jgi:hypothetical protein
VDHIRLDPKDGQQDKSKIIVGRNEDLRARVTCILGDRTIRIHPGSAHLRSCEVILVGTDRYLQVIMIRLCKAFIIVEADDHPFGLVEDRGQAGILLFLCFAGAGTWSTVAVQI